MTVGEKIKILRQRSGLSQAQLADELCVSRAAIAKWENDNGLPDITNLKALAAYMQVDMDALLDESKNIAEPQPAVPEQIPESFCGNSCSRCEYRQQLSCAGCRMGPGKPYSGACRVAHCCRNNHLSSCEVCNAKRDCEKIKRGPVQRKVEMDALIARREGIAKRSPILGKWLWVLFWLVVPANIGSVISQEFITQWLPWLSIPGKVLVAASNILYAAVLLRISVVEDRYRTAGLCGLGSGAIQLVLAFVLNGSELSLWHLLTIPNAILAVYGKYNEFIAHSIVLQDIDNALSQTWETVWKWYIGLYGAMLGSVLITFVIPILGVLVVLAAAIGLLVISVYELVLLYRTAKLFRGFLTAQ